MRKGEGCREVVVGCRLMMPDARKNAVGSRCIRRMDKSNVHTIKMEKDCLSPDMEWQVVRSTLCFGKREDKSVSGYEVAATFRSLSQGAGNPLDKFISPIGNG
jgi:hypothetical protein